MKWEKLCMKFFFGSLGFKHLHAFNLAMLGKQGWRFMTNQDTRVIEVLKAKYFPTGNFLEAPLRHNPSFIWHSIHASQVVVNQGLKWRIGNGKLISVWNQPWLNSRDNLRIISPLIAGGENVKVCHLFDNSLFQWNQNLIDLLFCEEDKLHIQQDPILNTKEDDKMIWTCNNNGNYIVRSAYHLIMNTIVDNGHLTTTRN